MKKFEVVVKFESLVFSVEGEDETEAQELVNELAYEYNVCDIIDWDSSEILEKEETT